MTKPHQSRLKKVPVSAALLSIKTFTLLLLVVALIIGWQPNLSHVHPGWGLVAALLVESTVIVSALSPLAVFSLIFAIQTIENEQYLFLFLGFVSAIIGNYLSFVLGQQFGKGKGLLVASGGKPWLTYWHPQLASITAFELGASRVRFRAYVRAALPAAVSYYAITLIFLGTVSTVITGLSHNSIDAWLVALLLAWIAIDLIRFSKS